MARIKALLLIRMLIRGLAERVRRCDVNWSFEDHAWKVTAVKCREIRTPQV